MRPERLPFEMAGIGQPGQELSGGNLAESGQIGDLGRRDASPGTAARSNALVIFSRPASPSSAACSAARARCAPSRLAPGELARPHEPGFVTGVRGLKVRGCEWQDGLWFPSPERRRCGLRHRSRRSEAQARWNYSAVAPPPPPGRRRDVGRRSGMPRAARLRGGLDTDVRQPGSPVVSDRPDRFRAPPAPRESASDAVMATSRPRSLAIAGGHARPPVHDRIDYCAREEAIPELRKARTSGGGSTSSGHCNSGVPRWGVPDVRGAM